MEKDDIFEKGRLGRAGKRYYMHNMFFYGKKIGLEHYNRPYCLGMFIVLCILGIEYFPLLVGLDLALFLTMIIGEMTFVESIYTGKKVAYLKYTYSKWDKRKINFFYFFYYGSGLRLLTALLCSVLNNNVLSFYDSIVLVIKGALPYLFMSLLVTTVVYVSFMFDMYYTDKFIKIKDLSNFIVNELVTGSSANFGEALMKLKRKTYANGLYKNIKYDGESELEELNQRLDSLKNPLNNNDPVANQLNKELKKDTNDEIEKKRKLKHSKLDKDDNVIYLKKI